MSIKNIALAFWNHQTGPKTLHFWAPMANWGFVIQGIRDWNREGKNISKEMEIILCSIY